MSFLLECFYLFVKDICLLQFGGPPDSKLDLVCSNCLVLFCRIPLELQHHTTSSHCSVRNTIFILFTRSDFFHFFRLLWLWFPYEKTNCREILQRMRQCSKFWNSLSLLCLLCLHQRGKITRSTNYIQFSLFVGYRQGGPKKCLIVHCWDVCLSSLIFKPQAVFMISSPIMILILM